MPHLRTCITVLFAVILVTCVTGQGLASYTPRADRIVVKKAKRQLYLYQGEYVIRSYPISLGKNPVGHKQRLGDQRTPEGLYRIAGRNPQSRFHLALKISYPAPDDRRRANAMGVNPGGSIMIHGLPKKYADGAKVMLDLDWTDGCIAVSNQDMDEIWDMVADNTEIVILP